MSVLKVTTVGNSVGVIYRLGAHRYSTHGGILPRSVRFHSKLCATANAATLKLGRCARAVG